MAQLRRKMRLAIQLYETTNSNRLKTGDPLTCELYPAGAQIETIVTVAAGIGITTDISCSGRGSLPVGASVRLIRDTGGIWADIAATDFTISSIEELGSAEGVFIYKIANTSATTTFATVIGDRIVAKRDATNRVTIYQDESDPADTVTQPIDVPTDGIVEGYVDERGLDVFLYGATITDNWTAFNVATSSGEIGPMRLKAETLAADALMNIDADTSVVLLNANTNPINLLEHCAPNRILILYPGAAGTRLTTFNTKGDNTIYEATGRTINLDQDEPFMLIGNAGAANVAYWSILATPALIDFGLDELSDVATAGAAAGEPLVYDGASWVPNSAIGTSAAPLTKVYAADNGLILGTAGSTAQITTSNLTGARVYSFPDSSTILLGITGNADVSGLKRFIVGAGGFKMSEIGFSRIAEFSVSGISAATTRVFTFPDKNGTFALISDLSAYVDTGDIDVAGAASGEILRYNGTKFVSSTLAGSSAAPLTNVYIDALPGTSLNLYGATGKKVSFVERGGAGYGIGADREFGMPNIDGSMLLDSTNLKQVTVTIPFTTTTGLFDMLKNDRNGHLCLALNSGATWQGPSVITKIDYQWVGYSAAAAIATPIELMVYGRGTLPTATTVPPSGSFAALISNIPILSSAQYLSGTIQGQGILSIAYPFIILAIAAGTNDPGIDGHLVLNIEYTVISGKM